ncbi:hypothetical protein [Nonomuraea sp. NPDC049725]|uniref:hypothetical protein n=1 Tax=Nonomuraea sp. NPDC049725 TaxID=3154508 RepID=UPI0034416F17
MKLMLVQWLRANGYRKLCKGEVRNYEKKSKAISVNIVLSILLGLTIFTFYRLDWSLWASAGVILGAFGVIVILHITLKVPAKLGTYAILYLWLALGGWQLWIGDSKGLLLSHALPFLVIIGTGISFRSLRLSFHVPLFVPVALIVVLLPLLTEDPWRLAATAGARLAWLAGVSILPLAVLLVIRLARLQVVPVFQFAAEKIDNNANRVEELFRQLKKYQSDTHGKSQPEELKARLSECYASLSSEDAGRAVMAADRAFRWRAVRRFVSLIVGVLLAVWALIYILAWAAVPEPLAAEWSKEAVSMATLDLLGFQLALPVGPYVLVATMLATVACVGFLGFALTDDQYSTALWDALVNGPAEAYLLAAVAYIRLSGATSIDESVDS